MKRYLWLFISGLFIQCLFFPVQAQEPQTNSSRKGTVVLVAPFENMSKVRSMIEYEVGTSSDPKNPKRTFPVDRYSEAPRAILEDILQGIDNVSAVERTRLDALLLESEFGRLSGLVDSEKAAKLGKMLGAKAVVMGTIMDVSTEKKSFSGYAIETRTTLVKCSLRVRIIDIETSRVTLSKTLRGSVSYSSSSFGGVENSDVAYGVIESTLEQLRDDEQFKAAVSSGKRSVSAAGGITVEFAPKPENCDVEIDGNYIGGSPQKKTFSDGKAVKVRLSKAGYKAWETTIVPEPGLRITKELEQESISKQPK
jgi:curli biogenesis system outer membrane secretion channel CsgG